MPKLIRIILLFIPTFLHGQATERVTNKKTNEVYYVFKFDTTIRQGSYHRTESYNGKLEVDGYYKNGIKDSIWTFYNIKGEIEQKYDYSKKQLLFDKDETNQKSKKFKVLKGNDTIETLLDQYPVLLGGSTVFDFYNPYDVHYPDSAKMAHIKGGMIYIVFTVDTNGKAINFTVTKGIYPCLDREALRLTKKLPSNWIPGVLNGKKVDVLISRPTDLELQ